MSTIEMKNESDGVQDEEKGPEVRVGRLVIRVRSSLRAGQPCTVSCTAKCTKPCTVKCSTKKLVRF